MQINDTHPEFLAQNLGDSTCLAKGLIRGSLGRHRQPDGILSVRAPPRNGENLYPLQFWLEPTVQSLPVNYAERLGQQIVRHDYLTFSDMKTTES